MPVSAGFSQSGGFCWPGATKVKNRSSEVMKRQAREAGKLKGREIVKRRVSEVGKLKGSEVVKKRVSEAGRQKGREDAEW